MGRTKKPKKALDRRRRARPGIAFRISRAQQRQDDRREFDTISTPQVYQRKLQALVSAHREKKADLAGKHLRASVKEVVTRVFVKTLAPQLRHLIGTMVEAFKQQKAEYLALQKVVTKQEEAERTRLEKRRAAMKVRDAKWRAKRKERREAWAAKRKERLEREKQQQEEPVQEDAGMDVAQPPQLPDYEESGPDVEYL